MKFLFIFLLSLTSLTPNAWETDFSKAKTAAAQGHKLILLAFSGSDWCGPCIMLHKDIFDSPAFLDYAATHLVLLNADFPRLKKNKLLAAQQMNNDHLADLYNSKGVFPLTVLLTAEGKVLKSWEGKPDLNPDGFVQEVSDASTK